MFLSSSGFELTANCFMEKKPGFPLRVAYKPNITPQKAMLDCNGTKLTLTSCRIGGKSALWRRISLLQSGSPMNLSG
ncbi:hypothetical protein TNCV_2584881 [Trichonephila clavipes]|nr:hypothetical protein TNCV_2584881 [Trichonephila clavipes]